MCRIMQFIIAFDKSHVLKSPNLVTNVFLKFMNLLKIHQNHTIGEKVSVN